MFLFMGVHESTNLNIKFTVVEVKSYIAHKMRLYIVSGLFLPFNKPKVGNGIHSIELLLFEINRAIFSKFLHKTVELFKTL